MAMSGQQMPDRPAVTLGTMTYLALIMEELGETMEAVHDAVLNEDTDDATAMYSVAVQLVQMRKVLKAYSLSLRSIVSSHSALLKKVHVPLNARHAQAIADGFTDLVVVAAGGAISTGIPGAECYEQVVQSNISKANPVTGRIDLDPSGKWIKGPNWKEADLAGLLAPLCVVPVPEAPWPVPFGHEAEALERDAAVMKAMAESMTGDQSKFTEQAMRDETPPVQPVTPIATGFEAINTEDTACKPRSTMLGDPL